MITPLKVIKSDGRYYPSKLYGGYGIEYPLNSYEEAQNAVDRFIDYLRNYKFYLNRVEIGQFEEIIRYLGLVPYSVDLYDDDTYYAQINFSSVDSTYWIQNIYYGEEKIFEQSSYADEENVTNLTDQRFYIFEIPVIISSSSSYRSVLEITFYDYQLFLVINMFNTGNECINFSISMDANNDEIIGRDEFIKILELLLDNIPYLNDIHIYNNDEVEQNQRITISKDMTRLYALDFINGFIMDFDEELDVNALYIGHDNSGNPKIRWVNNENAIQ